MRFIRIDESNIELATKMEEAIFPHYSAFQFQTLVINKIIVEKNKYGS